MPKKPEKKFTPYWKPTPAEQTRKSSHARGYNHQWRASRLAFLAKNPLCVHCLAEGITTLANVVDHIIPHKGNQTLFWDMSNWQALCTPCHNRKTAKEDMGGWQ